MRLFIQIVIVWLCVFVIKVFVQLLSTFFDGVTNFFVATDICEYFILAFYLMYYLQIRSFFFHFNPRIYFWSCKTSFLNYFYFKTFSFGVTQCIPGLLLTLHLQSFQESLGDHRDSIWTLGIKFWSVTCKASVLPM